MIKKFTATRIERKTLEKLRIIAEADNRTIPTTLTILIDAELARRIGDGKKVDILPHPDDAQPILVIEAQS